MSNCVVAAVRDPSRGSDVGGVLMLSSPIVGTNPHRVAGLTLAYKLPAITLFVEFAQSGGLLSYGPDNSAMYRQVGVLIRKLMQGESAAEIPIERPARFELAVNLKIGESDRRRRANLDPRARRRGNRMRHATIDTPA